jgi:hypothetical protein
MAWYLKIFMVLHQVFLFSTNEYPEISFGAKETVYMKHFTANMSILFPVCS